MRPRPRNFVLKKTPRHERQHSRCRVVSTAFPAGLAAIGEQAFVPNLDYMALLRKYEWLVRRRRKEIDRQARIKQES